MDRSLLNKATGYDDAPVSGLDLVEIAKMTHVSQEVCEQMAEYLLHKLKKDSPHVGGVLPAKMLSCSED